jgi:GDP-4-dehydro-6-deoxy-D-mannose reductase
VVRPFNIVGPGSPAHYLAAALAGRLFRAKAAGASGDFPVANADVTRDFVDVRDVVGALLALATRTAPAPGEAALYNVASGRETTVRAVAQKLCTLAGGFRAVDAGSSRSRSGILRSCGDASRVRKAVGWVAQMSWEQSLEDLWRSIDGPEPSPHVSANAGDLSAAA